MSPRLLDQLGRWCTRHGYTLEIRNVYTLPPGVVAGARFVAGGVVRVDVGSGPVWPSGHLIEAIQATGPGEH